MNFQQFQTNFKDFIIFSLTDARKIDPDFDRRRFSEWQKKGYLTKVRKGYYTFADKDITEELLFLFANVIYAPSYVSFETALSFYGFIPEGTYEITSATTREKTSFRSPVGRFSYGEMHRRMFFGYELQNVRSRSYKIASPEKALLDYLYMHPNIRDENDFEGMRFDAPGMRERLNMKTFEGYRDRFEVQAFSRRAHALQEFILHHD